MRRVRRWPLVFDALSGRPQQGKGGGQSAQGTDKVDAIIHCHLASGCIGKEGVGPFSLMGQPNAMGGREVGGLANMLTAHMGFASAEVDRSSASGVRL